MSILIPFECDRKSDDPCGNMGSVTLIFLPSKIIHRQICALY